MFYVSVSSVLGVLGVCQISHMQGGAFYVYTFHNNMQIETKTKLSTHTSAILITSFLIIWYSRLNSVSTEITHFLPKPIRIYPPSLPSSPLAVFFFFFLGGGGMVDYTLIKLSKTQLHPSTYHISPPHPISLFIQLTLILIILCQVIIFIF